MTDINQETDNTVQNGTANINAGGAKRSSSYPALTVLESYAFANKVYEKFSNGEVTRKEIASVLNLHHATISRDLAAAAAFGFLEKTSRKTETEFRYKVSQLFDDVLRPENDKEKKISLIIAFGKPKLYEELIGKFDGQIIPEELVNTLIKHHGITITASKECADIFIKSGQEVGAINDNRVLNYKVTLSATAKSAITEAEIISHEPEVRIENPLAKVMKPEFQRLEDVKKVDIHLTNDKVAYIVYPRDLNDDDIAIIDHSLQGIKLRLKLEQKNKGVETTPS
jgi:hypothetical protein